MKGLIKIFKIPILTSTLVQNFMNIGNSFILSGNLKVYNFKTLNYYHLLSTPQEIYINSL